MSHSFRTQEDGCNLFSGWACTATDLSLIDSIDIARDILQDNLFIFCMVLKLIRLLIVPHICITVLQTHCQLQHQNLHRHLLRAGGSRLVKAQACRLQANCLPQYVDDLECRLIPASSHLMQDRLAVYCCAPMRLTRDARARSSRARFAPALSRKSVQNLATTPPKAMRRCSDSTSSFKDFVVDVRDGGVRQGLRNSTHKIGLHSRSVAQVAPLNFDSIPCSLAIKGHIVSIPVVKQMKTPAAACRSCLTTRSRRGRYTKMRLAAIFSFLLTDSASFWWCCASRNRHCQ